jgi:hypothetical protein
MGRLYEIHAALKRGTQEAQNNREVDLEWSTERYDVYATVEVTSRRGVHYWTITDLHVLDRKADKDLNLTDDEVQTLRGWIEKEVYVSHEHDEEDSYWDEYDFRETSHRDG